MDAPRIAPGGPREVGLVTWALAHAFGRRSGTRPPAVFLTIGRHRRLFRGWLHFAGRLMPGGRLPRPESELVILRVAHLTGSEYEATQHRGLARRAGLSAAEVERVPLGPDAPGWTERQRLLLRTTDELHADRDLSDLSWTELRSELDEETCLELVMLVGHYELLATTLRVLRVPPDPPR
ncbi:carboxymuconolactone decarboxylase family protein [Nocardioides sp. SYSU DS0663]|uniref:carboxymuconolactone decarboxylase family protein n=1 Tax=Nocardioides sp. SYSU DS0663 TaxID=3416445 RepID=UPI003F4C83F7